MLVWVSSILGQNIHSVVQTPSPSLTSKAMCQSSTVESKRMYESMKNKVNKAVSKAMKQKAEESPTELQNS